MKKLPEKYVTIIALLVFEDVPPLPLTGFIAETIDTHEPYFQSYNKYGYDVSLIKKWDYLDEVLPGYCLPCLRKRPKSLPRQSKAKPGPTSPKTP